MIGWLKDIEGRYVYANRCYVEQLGAAEHRLLGRTDAELPVREAIDGPRLRMTAARLPMSRSSWSTASPPAKAARSSR